MSTSLTGKSARQHSESARTTQPAPFPVVAVALIAIFLLLLLGMAGLRAQPVYLECDEVTESFADTVSIQPFVGSPGDTVWMSIDLKNDSLLLGFSFLVTYDSALLKPIPNQSGPPFVMAEPAGRIVQDTTTNFYTSQSPNPFDSGALIVAYNATYVDTTSLQTSPGGSGTVARVAFVVSPGAQIGQSTILDFHAVNEFVVNPQNSADTFFADCRRSQLAVEWNNVSIAATIYPTTMPGAFTVQEAILQPPTIACYDSSVAIMTCGPDTICLALPIIGADSVWSDAGMWSGGQFCALIDQSGLHEFSIHAQNEAGRDSCTISIDATVLSEPVACFHPDPIRGSAPLPVSFTNCSVFDGNASYWWDFGDGNTSTEYEPIHVYSEIGYYAVTLVVSNECGVDSLVVDSAVGVQIGSPQWIVISCASPLFNGLPLEPGDVVTALDPDGVLCGVDTIGTDGLFGFMPIYADDLTSNGDEGADPGDTITILINGVEVETNPTVVWTTFGDEYSVCEFSTERCLTLDLSPGWNLISWNIAYSAATSDWLAQHSGCIDVVVGFSQGGLVYDPLLPEFSTLASVDYYHGYWINVSCPIQMELCGPPIDANQTIPIFAGWNLIGYWPQSSTSPNDALATIADNVEFAYGFDGQILAWDPAMPQFSTLTAMFEGLGYWVLSEAVDTLVYPGFAAPIAVSPSAIAAQPFRAAPSRQFVAVYGENLTIDGQPIRNGADLSFRSSSDLLSGIGQYHDGRLKMTPIYGITGAEKADSDLPRNSDTVRVFIDGKRVYPDVIWSAAGDRLRLGSFTSGEDVVVPMTFVLDQNYPNPFNPSTTIAFSLGEPGETRLAVYNIVGQQVRSLIDRHLDAGEHEVVWDGRSDDGHSLPSGVYFYRLSTNDFNRTMRMTLLK